MPTGAGGGNQNNMATTLETQQKAEAVDVLRSDVQLSLTELNYRIERLEVLPAKPVSRWTRLKNWLKNINGGNK